MRPAGLAHKNRLATAGGGKVEQSNNLIPGRPLPLAAFEVITEERGPSTPTEATGRLAELGR